MELPRTLTDFLKAKAPLKEARFYRAPEAPVTFGKRHGIPEYIESPPTVPVFDETRGVFLEKLER
jgi:hypothetical protein